MSIKTTTFAYGKNFTSAQPKLHLRSKLHFAQSAKLHFPSCSTLGLYSMGKEGKNRFLVLVAMRFLSISLEALAINLRVDSSCASNRDSMKPVEGFSLSYTVNLSRVLPKRTVR